MHMTPKNREVGKGRGRYKTRFDLINYLLDGPKEKRKLARFFRERLGIKHNETIKYHRGVLEDEGVIDVNPTGPGKSNIWELKKNYIAFKYVHKLHENFKKIKDLLNSEYIDNTIDHDFFYECINTNYPSKPYIVFTYFITKEEVTHINKIIKISPSCLKTFLNLKSFLGKEDLVEWCANIMELDQLSKVKKWERESGKNFNTYHDAFYDYLYFNMSESAKKPKLPKDIKSPLRLIFDSMLITDIVERKIIIPIKNQAKTIDWLNDYVLKLMINDDERFNHIKESSNYEEKRNQNFINYLSFSQ